MSDLTESNSEWEHEGKFCITIGLLQLWWNPKMVRREHFHSDPPKLRRRVLTWLKSVDAKYYPSPMVGPPIFEFNSEDDRARFKAKFCETPERLRQIMDDGVEINRLRDRIAWIEQGRRRDERGLAIFYSKRHKTDLVLMEDYIAQKKVERESYITAYGTLFRQGDEKIYLGWEGNLLYEVKMNWAALDTYLNVYCEVSGPLVDGVLRVTGWKRLDKPT